MADSSEKFLSILIPTRLRFDKLTACLDKFASQIPTAQLSMVEFIIKFDADDHESIARINELPFDKFDLQVYVAPRLGGYKDLYVFYNQCARLSHGKLIMMWNDDATFKTENWFEILQREFVSGTSARSYWFGGTPTTVQNPDRTMQVQDWPCFIAHHRLFYEIIGFYSHIGGVDSFLYYVLGPLGLLQKIEEIEVDHIAWFNIPENERDKTSLHNSEPGQMLPTDFKVVEWCHKRLRDYAARQQAQQRPAGMP